MVLVDSSIWIEALRRRGDIYVKLAVDALTQEYEAQICSPIRLEVLGGARLEERKKIEAYFSVIPYIPVDEITWSEALKLGWRLRDRGFTIPWNDLVIAAQAIRSDVRLYAKDKHFGDIAAHSALKLYVPGYNGAYEPG